MAINPAIVSIVLRAFWLRISRHNSTAKSMFIKILILGLAFETTYGLRILLLVKQDEWKQSDPYKYNLVFTLYILCGEILCQVVLLVGILQYTHRLRRKHLWPAQRDQLLVNASDYS